MYLDWPVEFFTICTLTALIFQMISMPFVLATLIVYAILPDLRKAQGIPLMGHMLGLLVEDSGYVFLHYWVLIDKNAMGMTEYQASILGAYMATGRALARVWLHVISIDLWMKFRKFSAASENNGQRDAEERWKMVAYAIYAIIMTVCVAWLHIRTAGSLYLNMMYFTLSLANVIFFGIVALKIQRIRDDISRFATVDGHGRSKHSAALEISLFVRLSVITGLIQAVQMAVKLPMIVVMYDHDVFYFLEVFIQMQGLMLFVLFVMKKNVIAMLRTKLCCFERNGTNEARNNS